MGSVYDEILNNNGGKLSGVPEDTNTETAITQANQGGKLDGVPEDVVGAQVQGDTRSSTAGNSSYNTPAKKPGEDYDKILKQMYSVPTAEELEKERRKRKHSATLSAVVDGLTALSNLYFTTRGANNSIVPNNSMSAKTSKRWAQIEADRAKAKDKYLAASDKLRNWNHLIERERLADERYKSERAEAQKRYEDAANAQAQEREENKAWREKTFQEQQRQFNETQARLKEHSDNAAKTKKVAEEAAKARGNEMFMYDGETGETYKLWGKPYQDRIPIMYAAIAKEIKARREAGEKDLPFVKLNVDTKEMDTFIKQNWWRTQEGRNMMKRLIDYDPAELNKPSDSIIKFVPDTEDIPVWDPNKD